MEGSADRPRQGPRQGGLSDAGNVLDQKVAAREQRDDRVANGAGLAAQDASDVAFERGDQLCRRREPLAGHRGGAHALVTITPPVQPLREGWLHCAKTFILETL